MMDYSTDNLILWTAWTILAAVLAFQGPDCTQFAEWSDSWIECTYNEPIDLTPTEGK